MSIYWGAEIIREQVKNTEYAFYDLLLVEQMAGSHRKTFVMKKNFAEQAIVLIDSINSIISKNQCSFSTEDVLLLKKCISKLKTLSDSEALDSEMCLLTLTDVISELDVFFGLGDYISQLMNKQG